MNQALKSVHKLVFLGESSVGKSCLVHRIMTNEFTDNALATLNAACFKYQLKRPSYNFSFDIWDTSGQERYAAMTPMYYRGAQFAAIVFDVSQYSTFLAAKTHYEAVKTKSLNPNIIIALVANKADLDGDCWKVDSSEAKQFATSHGIVYAETSAKTGRNCIKLLEDVEEAFQKGATLAAEPPPVKTVLTTNMKKGGCC